MEIEKQYSAKPEKTPQKPKNQNYAPKIRVCIRKRPLSKKERSKGEKDTIMVLNGKEVHIKENKVGLCFLKFWRGQSQVEPEGTTCLSGFRGFDKIAIW